MPQGVRVLSNRFFLLLVCLSLTGCLSVTVEEELAPAAKFNLAVSSHPLTNLDLSGRPSPTVVRVYQLRKEVDFKEAGFFDLYDQDKALLAGDLVAREELIVIPGSFLSQQFMLASETKFVAVMAAFQDTANAIQKQIIPVDSSKDLSIVAYLNSNLLSVSMNRAGGESVVSDSILPASTNRQAVKLEDGEVKINPLKLKDCKDAGVVDLLVKEGC